MLHMITSQVPGWLQAWREIELSVKPRLALLQTRRSVRRTPSSSSMSGGIDGHRVRAEFAGGGRQSRVPYLGGGRGATKGDSGKRCLGVVVLFLVLRWLAGRYHRLSCRVEGEHRIHVL